MRKSEGIVVSVGAGVLQYEFIDRLKKRGYIVASFGKGKNSNAAIRCSDYFKEIDTSDANEAIKWLDGFNMPIIAAGSCAGGVAIKTLQVITNHYNLATKIPENLIIGMNKIEQQSMYEKYDLSYIPTYLSAEIASDTNLLDVEKQYIIKPIIGRGSNGVEVAIGKEIIKRIGSEELKEGDMIQTVVYGREYRILLMVQGGQIKLLVPVHRTSFKQPFFLGRLEVSFLDYGRIKEHAQKIIDNLRIKNAVIKYDIIVDGEIVNLIEMDIGVGGGTYFKKYMSMVTGVDLMETYIDLICDREITQMQCKNPNLIMDYVYNESSYPVEYDLLNCKKEIEDMYGKVVLIQNKLHPEKKGGFYSNADFLFTAIYEKKGNDVENLNNYVNCYLLKKVSI